MKDLKTLKPKNQAAAKSLFESLMEKGYKYLVYRTGEILDNGYMLVDYDQVMVHEKSKTFTSCDWGCDHEVERAYERLNSLDSIQDPLLRLTTKWSYFGINDPEAAAEEIKRILS